MVSLSGKDFYRGLWNPKASRLKCVRMIAELPAAYRQWAEKHYRRDDATPTGKAEPIKPIARRMSWLYSSLTVDDFGLLQL